jgi:hypothetical protein
VDEKSLRELDKKYAIIALKLVKVAAIISFLTSLHADHLFRQAKMNNSQFTELILEISAPDTTAEDIDQMTRQLLSELKELEVESVELAKGNPAPERTKSVDPVTTGAIALAVLPTVLPKIVEAIQAWALRGNNRTVKFKGKIAGQTIEFEGHAEDLQKLLETVSAKKGRKSS